MTLTYEQAAILAKLPSDVESCLSYDCSKCGVSKESDRTSGYLCLAQRIYFGKPLTLIPTAIRRDIHDQYSHDLYPELYL